ncbi:hypothetical protein [Labrenzia sp. VG12]|uniref:hypothetical protein n=1 Tax=Labrenzia sp. VG12 TaxID=2021862 RepID=UPI0012FE394E|nr:hypothetical protein [Labrenzia sp. VG12]
MHDAFTMEAFELLGIAHPEQVSRKQIRSAYAKRLKQIDPAEDPQGFQALRNALETALAFVDGEGTGPAKLDDVPSPLADPADGNKPGKETDRQAATTPAEPIISAAELGLAELQCLRLGDNTVSTITRLLNDTAFDDLEMNKQLERELVLFLDRRLVMKKGGIPSFTSDITPGLMKAMAARFDWLTDYRGIEKNAGRPELVSMAISFLIGAEQTRQQHQREAMALWDWIMGIAIFVGIPLGVAAQFLEKDSIWQLLAGGAAGVSFLVIMFVLMRR